MEGPLAQSQTKQNRRIGGSPPQIPDKLYFRIGEVARLLRVEPFVLRFWETEFSQLKPGKGGTGQRLYRRRDVETAFEIRHLLYEEGYTIPGARQILQGNTRNRETQVSVPPTESTLNSASLRHIRKELQEIAGILSRPVLTRQANASTRAASCKLRERIAEDARLPLFAKD